MITIVKVIFNRGYLYPLSQRLEFIGLLSARKNAGKKNANTTAQILRVMPASQNKVVTSKTTKKKHSSVIIFTKTISYLYSNSLEPILTLCSDMMLIIVVTGGPFSIWIET